MSFRRYVPPPLSPTTEPNVRLCVQLTGLDTHYRQPQIPLLFRTCPTIRVGRHQLSSIVSRHRREKNVRRGPRQPCACRRPPAQIQWKRKHVVGPDPHAAATPNASLPASSAPATPAAAPIRYGAGSQRKILATTTGPCSRGNTDHAADGGVVKEWGEAPAICSAY